MVSERNYPHNFVAIEGIAPLAPIEFVKELVQ